MVLRGSVLVTARSGLFCLQMMWFCCFHQPVTSSSLWIGFQPSLKRLGWEAAPPNLRPEIWFLSRKRWNAFSRSGRRSCPEWRSLCTSGSCSQVRGNGAGDRQDDQCSVCSDADSVLVRVVTIYQAIFIPTLAYGHELLVVTEIMRLRVSF